MLSFFQRRAHSSTPLSANQTGRFSDAGKSSAQLEAWEQSIQAFENGQFLPSMALLMDYLYDPQQHNVAWQMHDDLLTFELCQGSNLIRGQVTAHHFRAETLLATINQLNPAYLRRLVEHNANFNYFRYALNDDQGIVAVVDAYAADASPYKVYYALKELATNADKLDDLLLDEFAELSKITEAPRTDLPLAEKEFKYQFLIAQIKQALAEMDQGPLDKVQFPGGIGYILLSLVFKLDYLIQPQGYMMETLERIIREYFAGTKSAVANRNQDAANELLALANRPKADFFKEMYRVSYTFGITTPVKHAAVVSFIDNELPNMDWYAQQGLSVAAKAVTDFLAGYCLFNYAPPEPIRQLLDLYVFITEPDFFQGMGFNKVYFDKATQKLAKKDIINAINAIEAANKKKFPALTIPYQGLNFSHLTDFVHAYLRMIQLAKVD
jgi:hypothetical protein